MNIFKKREKRLNEKKDANCKNNRSRPKKAGKGGLLCNMKIAPKILTGILIISILCAGLGGVSVLGLKTVSDNTKVQYSNILLPTKLTASISDYLNEESILLRQALLHENESMVIATYSKIKNNITNISQVMSMIDSYIPEEKKSDFEKVKISLTAFHTSMNTSVSNIKSGNKQVVLEDIINNGDLNRTETQAKKALNDFRFSISSDASVMNTKSNETADMIMRIMLFSVSGVLLLSVLIGLFLSRGISKPLKMLTANAKRLAAGEIVNDISAKRSKDEVGQIWEAFMTVLQSLEELVADTNMLIEAATRGELTARANVEKHRGAYRKIIEGINATLDAVVAPMIESSNVLKELSEGNLNTEVSGEFLGDFALVKDALNETIETLKGYINDITYVLGEIAKGRLDISISSDYKGEFIAIKDSINESLKSFNTVIRDINIAAQEVADRTLLLSNGSQTISQGATEQASALEELTASLDEIAQKTNYNAQKANNASDLSIEVKEGAIKGTAKMKELQAAMQEINSSSENISKIIKVIDDIAFQTNILSLNAAVEAARAGTRGKGFAVVADEVRNLAAKSSKAAKDTSVLIENSIASTKIGKKIADETANSLMEIVDKIERNVDISKEISVASNEQAMGITQVNIGIEQLSAVVQTNSASAQEAAASSEELSGLADHLKGMVKKFTLKDQ